MTKDYKNVRQFANSGELRSILESANIPDKIIQSIVDRCCN